MNDPAGNVFDLAHAAPKNRDSVYGAGSDRGPTPRRVSHFLLRTLDPAKLAEFYHDVFELEEQPRVNGDPNFYLSDGTVTMVIGPWKIGDYAGTGIARPAMDHLGFKVESLKQFEIDMHAVQSANTALVGQSLTVTKENLSRLTLLKKCRLGSLQFSDPDGVLLDVSETD
jgi:hypothetical protein